MGGLGFYVYTALMEGEMGRMRSAGFLFLSFSFFFALPSHRGEGRGGGDESKKQNIMNLGLGKQAIRFLGPPFINALSASLFFPFSL